MSIMRNAINCIRDFFAKRLISTEDLQKVLNLIEEEADADADGSVSMWEVIFLIPRVWKVVINDRD